MLPAMLRCESCWCISHSGRGWFAFITEDLEDDEQPVVVTYCPPCAEHELEAKPREPGYV
jgi:hypothetical protein